MKNDIFDLEQSIMNCWNVTDDLKILFEAVLERDLSKDEISNIILGMERLYHLKFEKLFENFETHCSEYHMYRNAYTPSNEIVTTVTVDQEDLHDDLLALLGSENLVTEWWKSPNRYFSMLTPEEAWEMDSQFVINYVKSK